jgi:CRISPR-associated endonuclease Csn1
MTISLGLDIGSNSVGSAWVDTEQQIVEMGVSIFPAGVDEQEDKRGAPKNQARRQARAQRRMIDRRARRKRRLVAFLVEHGLLPREPGELRKLFDLDPWPLRRNGVHKPLTPFEFGRVLVHMAQRRGAVGVTTDPEDPEEGKVKEGMDRLEKAMKEQGKTTVGEFIADRIEQLRQPIARAPDEQCSRRTVQHRRRQAERSRQRGAPLPEPHYRSPVRNRQYRMPEEQQFFAGRELIRGEFHRIIGAQRSFRDSPLARLLTDDLVRQLDDPKQTDTWRHGGLLFGQRRTYWDTGTLGRCVLEPTERCVPIADRHASYFRVVETVNNLRVQQRGQEEQPLKSDERDKIIRLLRGPLGMHQKGKHAGKPKSTVSVTDIKQVLGINPRDKTVKLNIEADEDREINTDWFYREIVHGAFSEDRWAALSDAQRESVNRALLKFDPDHAEDANKLHAGAMAWWGLDAAAANRLIQAWKERPKLEKRLNLSRRAILNLLPYMEGFDADNNRWPTQQEARKAHAQLLRECFERDGEIIHQLAADRYATGALGLTTADRYYMRLEKHQIKHAGEIVHDAHGKPLAMLPPAPMLSNPVVRKAIHEVRRHLLAYLRKFRRKPDRVVIEMARITKQSERQRNLVLARNRHREKIRKDIIAEVLPAAFGEAEAPKLSLNQQRAAVDRVVLAKQQGQMCPYCGLPGLTAKIAAQGQDVETDHIVPYSRCGDDGLNNKVLAHRTCNRGKGNQTPRAWWGAGFDERIRFAEKLFKDAEPEKGDYFTKRDYARKWYNFTREVREGEDFKNSQLTDTAYAARQVAAYLADALFDGRGLPERGDGHDRQRIFFTVGKITLTLRKDWQLFETLKPQQTGLPGGLTAQEELHLAEKNRGDHREHAIDAVTIALTDPKIKTTLAGWAAQAAEYKEKYSRWPKRTPIPTPWGTVDSFRRQILSKVYVAAGSPADARLLIVSHRPVKRRLVDAFHEETHYGPVVGPLPSHRTENAETLFTNRISVIRLTANHLRVPEGWDELSTQLEIPTVPQHRKRAIRRQLAAMEDPSPAKSGIVRDRALRDRLRKCLRANGIDPDNFTAAQIKKVVADGKLAMASGVPIKGLVLMRTISEPVIIPRKRWDAPTGKMIPDMDPENPKQPHPRTKRIYIGGNNHHVEVRERQRKRQGATVTEWIGEPTTNFDAAKRNAARLDALRKAGLPSSAKLRRMTKQERQQLGPIISDICRRYSIVDRFDNDKGRFVMSLAEGEMIYARRWDSKAKVAVGVPDYFVVRKLDKSGNSCRIHFAPHWDARKASEQDRWDVTPGDLRVCGPEPGAPPYKVRVDPLGNIRRLDD